MNVQVKLMDQLVKQREHQLEVTITKAQAQRRGPDAVMKGSKVQDQDQALQRWNLEIALTMNSPDLVAPALRDSVPTS